jgi:hypothetical protein
MFIDNVCGAVYTLASFLTFQQFRRLAGPIE